MAPKQQQKETLRQTTYIKCKRIPSRRWRNSKGNRASDGNFIPPNPDALGTGADP